MEIVRRYYDTLCKKARGLADADEVYKLELIMNRAGVTTDSRTCVRAALDREAETGAPAVAIELADGTVVTGKTTPLLGASAAALLNALKVLGGINDGTTRACTRMRF